MTYRRRCRLRPRQKALCRNPAQHLRNLRVKLPGKQDDKKEMNRFRNSFIYIAACFTLTLLSSVAYGADGSSLKPPPGTKVAVFMFEDLECPKCAMDFPVVQDAAKKHGVP